MRFERILEESVAKYKPAVENLVGRNIGKVSVRPFRRSSILFPNLYEEELLCGSISYHLVIAKVGEYSFRKETESFIDFNPFFALSFLPKRSIEYLALHELGHIAHLKGRDKSQLMTNKNEHESIADFFAVSLLGENIPVLGKRALSGFNEIQEKLKKHEVTFQEALAKLF